MTTMTDPVDTEALRTLANKMYDITVRSSLRTAANEVDRLRAVIAARQHDDLCAVWELSGGTSDEGCTCWKADAL